MSAPSGYKTHSLLSCSLHILFAKSSDYIQKSQTHTTPQLQHHWWVEGCNVGALDLKASPKQVAISLCKAAGMQSIVWEVRNNSQPNTNMWNNVCITEKGLFIHVR